MEGSGQVVATDNGDPTCFTPFPSPERKAFSGLFLGIVKADGEGEIKVTATSEGLEAAKVIIKAE
ncbi:hypothetical protein [Carboxylicivirga caseinilyticus]|uniref:hypothetical protein n=1 Tax=Carboxylicivirga caseinilyticus TaxID=3417572 RepID=UPI003D333315|nr:hypothetical protein [Marinilabiliaceae bacterium A049]